MDKTKHTIIVLVTLCATAVLLSSCFVDGYQGKRPIDYPGTVWISENPYVWFKARNKDELEGERGKLVVGEREYNIKAVFDYGTTVFFIDTDIHGKKYFDDTVILSGKCKFSKSKLVVSIDEDDTNKVFDKSVLQSFPHSFWDKSVHQITFVRKDVTDSYVKDLADINGIALLDDTRFEKQQVIDDKIYLYYKVIFRNNTGKDKKFRLEVDFRGFQENKQVKERYIIGVRSSDNSEIIEIKAGETVTDSIVFIGEFAGKKRNIGSGLPNYRILD